MRQSTRNKLFNGMTRPTGNSATFRIMWEIDTTEVGLLTYLRIGVSGKIALIQECLREEDGFNVFTEVEGNDLESTHKALGLEKSLEQHPDSVSLPELDKFF